MGNIEQGQVVFDTAIIGAGDVVSKRMLPALLEKMGKSEKEGNPIQIYNLNHIVFKGNERWSVPERLQGFLSEESNCIFDLIKEDLSPNRVTWVATPSDTHLYYLRLLLEKPGFIVMEKPIVASAGDLDELQRLLSDKTNRERVFFLSYYVLEKALLLTFLKKPNLFYLHYFEDTMEDFYQAFLELGQLQEINVSLFEGCDTRDLPYGGQVIETLIHHCLIAALFVGLPDRWGNIEFSQVETRCHNQMSNETAISLYAVGENGAKISLALFKSAKNKKKQFAILNFENGTLYADFATKEAEIRFHGLDKIIKTRVSPQYENAYSVQCDMVYRCFSGETSPVGIDGLYFQPEVLKWLFSLNQKVKFKKDETENGVVYSRRFVG